MSSNVGVRGGNVKDEAPIGTIDPEGLALVGVAVG